MRSARLLSCALSLIFISLNWTLCGAEPSGVGRPTFGQMIDRNLRQASMLQDVAPRFLPPLQTDSPSLPSAASALPSIPSGLTNDLARMRPVESSPTFGSADLLRENPELSLILRRRRSNLTVARRRILGGEAISRVTTDAGDVFSKSVGSPGVTTQQRNPVVNDVRVRGSQTGNLAASGSYWVPARLDLDTALSKIDSRILAEIASIQGPYSVRYGPGYRHIYFDVLDSPRASKKRVDGISGIEYGTNGEQWVGRQTFAVSDEDWGIRMGYRHMIGSDYRTGNGESIPASYNSRDWNVAWGRDWDSGGHLEFHMIRLDQTDVELPGQAFDMDVLVTNGFDVEYRQELSETDLFSIETWYNETSFVGNAQNAGKRRQFPVFDTLDFVGFTEVSALSTGYRLAHSMAEPSAWQFDWGTDFRFVKQRLRETSSAAGMGALSGWLNANSPIPKSFQTDMGIFVEYHESVGDFVDVEIGVRADRVSARLDETPDQIQSLTPFELPLGEILGSDEFDQNYTLPTAYITSDLQLLDHLTMQVGVGHSQRPPNLTELYAAEPFMFVLQNGLNTVVGDPLLKPEKMTQFDVGLTYQTDSLLCQVGGFFGVARDFITYENMEVNFGEQTRLKYVNTDEAVLTGIEALAEADCNRWITLFSTLSSLRGTDQTRNGSFATMPANSGTPSVRDPTQVRGFFSGVPGGATEPLPNITPLEGRVGIRLRGSETKLRGLNVEFSARLVESQNRVASSLQETPTPGYSVFDIRSFYQFVGGTRIVAGIENIGDRAYRNHLDYRSPFGIEVLQPGVNLYIGGDLFY